MTDPNKPADPEKAYCDSCGELVPVAIVQHDETHLVKTCFQCGFPIQQKHEDIPAVSNLDSVIIVEDADLVRQIISEIIVNTGFAREITPCNNGEQFLSLITEMIASKKRVDMVFMDVMMPVLDGVNAALCLRAIEKGLQSPQPIPILFFTVKKCDEEFRQILHRVSPALYVNKEADASPEQLMGRIRNIVSRLNTPGKLPSFFQAKK